ncbi:hypothetical protein GCM10023339_61920 [Alloalcanivorax gelatiniphagus]
MTSTTSPSSTPSSARRVLVRAAVALLAPIALLAQPAPGSAEPTDPPSDVSTVATPHQRVRLQALPGIVQPGGRVATAAAARPAVVATLRPVTPGRRVQLQVLLGEVWEVVTVKRQDGRGRVQFAPAVAADGHASTYRVWAMASGRLRPVTSHPVSTSRWQHPTWTDEFAGSSLDPVWNHRGRDYVHAARRSCSKGDPRAVSVGDGAVRLSVLADPDATIRCRIRGRDKVSGTYAYRLNGHIGTQGSFGFRYGVAAARVKFHRMRGQHGAFWLQPVDGMYPGGIGSEIDVVEYFGDHHPQGGLATFMHRYDGRRRISSGGWIPDSRSYLQGRGDGWSRNYHVFSVEWSPNLVVFRIDGQETGRMRGGVSAVRQFPVLSLLAADYEVPKIRERHLPQHMYVDWVRVWETGG